MKNLKMFAIAIMAFAVMAMGVHATGNGSSPAAPNDYPNASCDKDNGNCIAKIGDHYFTYLTNVLADAKDGDTVELLRNVATGDLGGSISNANTKVKTSFTLNLAGFELDMGTDDLELDKNVTLTVKGEGTIKASGSPTAPLIKVADGAKLVTEGNVTLTGANSQSLITTAGAVTIGKGAVLDGTSGALIDVTSGKAVVNLNAYVGTLSAPSSASSVVTISAGAPVRSGDPVAKITFEDGDYRTAGVFVNVTNAAEVNVKGGNFVSTGKGFTVTDGSLNITGGTIETASTTVELATKGTIVVDGVDTKLTSNNNTVIETNKNATDGTITIKRGTLTAKGVYSPIYLQSSAVTTKVEGAQINGAKDVPAIYILDSLLTGMAEGGNDDVFKGMLTGGEFKYLIVGEAEKSKGAPADYTAAEVAKYLIAEGLEEKTEGSYKVLGNGAGNTPAGEPGTTEPGDQTTGDGNQGPTDNVPNPNTNDNILVYAGLGLVSLASVAFTTRKRED